MASWATARRMVAEIESNWGALCSGGLYRHAHGDGAESGGFEEGTNMLSKAGKGSADKASGSGFHGQREFKRQTEMSLNL